jgi:hypothetical protein
MWGTGPTNVCTEVADRLKLPESVKEWTECPPLTACINAWKQQSPENPLLTRSDHSIVRAQLVTYDNFVTYSCYCNCL